MNSLIQWFENIQNILAALVTAGVAVLLVCCIECLTAPSREEHDLFNRHAF